MKKNIKWIIFVVLIAIFGILAYGVCNNTISGFDNKVYEIVTSVTNPFLDNMYKFITFFGSVVGVILICVALIIFMKNKKNALYIVGGVGIATIINNVIKFIVRRERPLVRRLVVEKSYSFPSGHTMGSVALYGMIIFFIWRSKLDRTKKILYTVLLSLLTLMIMVSRIYLGAHFASDVLAGLMASSAFLIFYTNFIKAKK